MYMRVINGRWFTNIRDKRNPGKLIQVSLDAYKDETRKATVNLGKVLADIQNGINPTSARKKISRLKLAGKTNGRTDQLLRKHILPFFGELKPRELDETVMGKYIESRFGLTEGGELQAFPSTLKKELLVLKRLLQSVYGKNYSLPSVPYKRLYKKILPPLAPDQVYMVAEFVLDEYKPVYWLMAYTGMDLSDVVYLRPRDFQGNWIRKERGKTNQQIAVPICPPLAQILKPVPWPIKQDARIFPDMDPDAAGTHIRRSFTTAGLDGYGAKYLRRTIASLLLDQGLEMDWIGLALAHAKGSKLTQKYTKPYMDKLEAAFAKIKFCGKSVVKGLSKSE